MTNLQKLKRVLARICDAAALMVAGAWLLAMYLSWAHPRRDAVLEHIVSDLLLAFFAFQLFSSYLVPKAAPRGLKPPSPRWSGVAVVVATGAAAAFSVARSPISDSYVALAAIALGTLALAVLVWRFATIHAADIGEARFVSKGLH